MDEQDPPNGQPGPCHLWKYDLQVVSGSRRLACARVRAEEAGQPEKDEGRDDNEDEPPAHPGPSNRA
jgi:hypothetical protein